LDEKDRKKKVVPGEGDSIRGGAEEKNTGVPTRKRKNEEQEEKHPDRRGG